MAAIQFFDACALFGPWPQHEDLQIADVLKAMTANKIERALALCTTGITYDFREGNAATLEACAGNPNKLMPVATLDPRAYPACLDEAEKCASQGFKMIRFFPARQGWPIRYAPFRELLQKCDELHIPVAVECTHAGDATELADAVAFTQAPLLLAGVDSANIGEAHRGFAHFAQISSRNHRASGARRARSRRGQRARWRRAFDLRQLFAAAIYRCLAQRGARRGRAQRSQSRHRRRQHQPTGRRKLIKSQKPARAI